MILWYNRVSIGLSIIVERRGFDDDDQDDDDDQRNVRGTWVWRMLKDDNIHRVPDVAASRGEWGQSGIRGKSGTMPPAKQVTYCTTLTLLFHKLVARDTQNKCCFQFSCC